MFCPYPKSTTDVNLFFAVISGSMPPAGSVGVGRVEPAPSPCVRSLAFWFAFLAVVYLSCPPAGGCSFVLVLVRSVGYARYSFNFVLWSFPPSLCCPPAKPRSCPRRAVWFCRWLSSVEDSALRFRMRMLKKGKKPLKLPEKMRKTLKIVK